MANSHIAKAHRIRRLGASALAVASVALLVSACGTTKSTGATAAPKKPITIGFSVSLSGAFSNDGNNILHGYELWATYVNKHGGLLGRPVKLEYLNDASSTSQVVTNYETLINQKHVDLLFGPFSTLLTTPAAQVANRYGYAFPEGDGGGPSVFQEKLPDLVYVQPAPVVDGLVSFAHWILSLPKSERPKTVAYASSDDPFTLPQLQVARKILEKGGIKTAYWRVYPQTTTDYSPIAAGIINSKADAVILGTQEVDAIAFVQQFEQQHYNPKVLIETSGPDTGSQFAKAVGPSNTAGILVPSGWFAGANTYQNKTMVTQYLKTYGGKVGGISADVAQAWSVGQVVQQAVEKAHSINNKKLIQVMHSMTFKTVQGPLKFNAIGQPNGQDFLLQWQNGGAIPVYPAKFAAAQPLYPKPNWNTAK